ncbi:hypothetical protein [Streptomyces sp. ME19-01-6]|uniref:hypothetical protein n=1 Tax=Streptomyces sp. ME19-01-6 TaxID=3028686 RepID=UPI0029AEDE46|nr:hypothetical protein [Streptomyces sp. ME19-01-6]MDX3232507.1 hypothetical protein [Streptomyces sp. ME19-01-6]
MDNKPEQDSPSAPRWRRCGHGPGELHPGDHAVVDAFKRMLAASKRPVAWSKDSDIAVRVPTGVERALLYPNQDAEAGTVRLLLVHPDTGAVLTRLAPYPRKLILGPWDQVYRPLTCTAQGKETTHLTGHSTFREGAALTDPSLRCPQCDGAELTAASVHGPGGGDDVSAFTCDQCRVEWAVWETPNFTSPNYADAYAGAPGLAEEEFELVLLADDINLRATAALTGTGPSVPGIDHRLLLLRKAAWLDRAAREREVNWHLGDVPAALVDQGSAWAARAAHDFLTWDLEHDQDGVAGPAGPDSAAWNVAGGARAYVRQEYRAMLDQEREAEDRAQMGPRRGPDGELYNTDGKPL